MLELRRLQALHAVVSTGSVKEAAAQLGYTPSAISQHITTLQAETKTVLLEPAGRGVRPTAAGKMLTARAATLLDLVSQTESALEALNAGERGVLRLAAFATAGAELVPPALARVLQALPTLEITLRVADREEALQLLRSDQVDIAVIEAHESTVLTDPTLSLTPLLVDPFRIVLPRGHHLAKRRTVPLDAAQNESWLDLRCEVGCCRDATTAAFERAGFAPRRTIEADEYWAAQGFVAAGLGLALIPALALGIQHPAVVVRKVHPTHQAERQVHVVTRTTANGTVSTRTLLTELLQSGTRSSGARDF